MILGQPLFPGESASEQIIEIVKVLGSPSREQIFDMNSKYNGKKLPDIRHTP